MGAATGSWPARLAGWWQDEAAQHRLTRSLFIRLVALIYCIAFVSLWIQVDGLIGHNGILPAADFLKAVRQQTGPERYWLMPTLCWWNAGDGFLHFLCGGGAVISLLVMAGVAQGPGLLVLWVFYLSLLWVCREFLGFQWDVLLLETGFLALFFAPWRPFSRLAAEAPPSRLVLWLFRWLLFRVIFASGVVKLTSGDAMWRGLTALNVHYETQPLPTWIGWYIHQLPQWIHKLSVAGMFLIELLVPFLIFTPRPFRQVACGAFVFLQLAIVASGNYCFFNLLILALCVLLLDDSALRRLCPARWRGRLQPVSSSVRPHRWRFRLLTAAAVPLVVLGCLVMTGLFVPRPMFPSLVVRFQRAVAPWCVVNSYGLFAVMTNPRHEIVVEGSNDGVRWQAYEFKWKPGATGRAPSWVAPHQPRLDWQMWFAALGNHQDNPWFTNFEVRLLQGAPEVLALLDQNPFPEKPPRYVRALLYEYHFTAVAARRDRGDWWRRELKGLYGPPVTLQAAP
jgi:hypothetical protein